MKQLKRLCCGLLAAFLLAYSPAVAYASTASVAVSVGSYVLGLIMDACGVSFDLSAVSSILGQWTDYDDYMAQGSKGKLGGFSQYLYDRSQDNNLSAELRQDALDQIQTLNNAVNSVWGATISGVKSLISAVKSWLSGLTGYGTETLTYSASTRVPDYEWAEGNYVSASPYALRNPPSYTYIASYINNPDNEFVFSSYAPSAIAGCVQVRNWYKPVSVDVFGYYDEGTGVVSFYTKDGESGYKECNIFYYYAFVTADGQYKYSFADSDYGMLSGISVDRPYIGNLPFHVFSKIEDLESYCQDGVAKGTYKAGEVTYVADAADTNIQKAALKDIPDSITLPESAAAAEERLVAISVAVGKGEALDIEELKTLLREGGIAIDWDIDGTEDKDDTEDDSTTMKGILGAVKALPKSIADAIEERAETDGETARKRLTLSSAIIDKFPFCIPFDAIHLIEALAAEPEAPVFEFPIKFDYLTFHYEEVFRLDFSDFDSVVKIFRIMQDLLFCAGLISVTRHLIRG